MCDAVSIGVNRVTVAEVGENDKKMENEKRDRAVFEAFRDSRKTDKFSRRCDVIVCKLADISVCPLSLFIDIVFIITQHIVETCDQMGTGPRSRTS